MIVEGIVTTLDHDSSVRVAPMGPIVEPLWKRLVLRPFVASHTCENLQRDRQGVFHVTDDVELIALAAIGGLQQVPPVRPAGSVRGAILTDACRWYSFGVQSIEDHPPRSSMVCRVVESGFQREFLGFCRAKHAVVEAAILATRVHLLDAHRLRDEFSRLEPLVDKTGGEAEQRAFALLQQYVFRTAEPPAEAP